MRSLLYIIGIPGSGKTTLLGAALVGVPSIGQTTRPFTHVIYLGGCQLGALRGKFSGTDALSMSVQPKVVEWLNGPCPYVNIVGEGDRLANLSFFQGVLDAGWQLEVVYLAVPESIAQQRCVERGSAQDPSWWKGRVTKVRNLAASFPVTALDGTLPLQILTAQLQAFPVIQGLGQRQPHPVSHATSFFPA